MVHLTRRAKEEKNDEEDGTFDKESEVEEESY